MGKRYDLLSNQAADSAAVVVQPGGWYVWRCMANWVGDIKLQMQMPDGSTFADIAGAVLSANGSVPVLLPNGATVKAVRVGASTAIYSDLTATYP